MIQIHCNDCHLEISLATYLTRASFIGTVLEKEACSYSGRDFYGRHDGLYRSGRLKDDKMNGVSYLDGIKLMPEATRWEQEPVCPECGAKNVYWF